VSVGGPPLSAMVNRSSSSSCLRTMRAAWRSVPNVTVPIKVDTSRPDARNRCPSWRLSLSASGWSVSLLCKRLRARWTPWRGWSPAASAGWAAAVTCFSAPFVFIRHARAVKATSATTVTATNEAKTSFAKWLDEADEWDRADIHFPLIGTPCVAVVASDALAKLIDK